MEIQVNSKPEIKDIFYPGNIVEHICSENGIKTLVIVGDGKVVNNHFKGMNISDGNWYISDWWQKSDFKQCTDEVILTHKGI